jgi:CRP-like cAMP-binding protein
MTTSASVDELRQFQIFRSVSDSALEAVVPVLEERTFAPGEILFRRDDPGDAMYLVRSGRAVVFLTEPTGAEIIFRTYGPGQVVGEFALLDGKPRSASARSEAELRTWVLGASDFTRLLTERPVIGVELMRSIAERIRYTTDFLRKLTRAVDLLISSDYERALLEISASTQDDDVESLIAAFLEMVSSLRKRQTILDINAPPRVELDTSD